MSDLPVIARDHEAGAPDRRIEDKRSGRRHVTSMPALIIVSPYDRVPCVIRDLSDGGARIGLSRRHALSDRFWIVIRHAGVRRRASLIWRRGELAGIAFDHPFG